MLIESILAIVGLVLIYFSLHKLGKWKPVNSFFAFIGGGLLVVAAGISIILPPIVEFIYKIAHVS